MYCVDCGKEKQIFKEGSCLDCYLQNHQFSQGPEVFHIPVCTYCEAYKYKNTWQNKPFQTVLKRYIKNAFSFDPELNNINISVDCQGEEETIFCKIIIQGKINNEEISEEQFIEIRLNSNVCDVCSKQFGGYHEAIVQIRTTGKKMKDQQKITIESFLNSLIGSMKDKGNRQLFITDINYKKTGLDYLLSDKQAAASIIKKTQEEFSGDITVSSSNVGMKDGKQVYRMTYLLRLPSFGQQNILSKDEDVFLVLSLSSNMVHVLDLKTWEKRSVQIKDFENANVYEYEDLVEDMIVVSQTDDDIQVMDKKTYALTVIKKPKKKFFPSEQIPVIRFEDSLYIIPNEYENK